MHVRAAVPWLIAVYDSPTAFVEVKNKAAAAAIRIDPGWSRDFLREVMNDESLAAHGYGNSANATAAAALAAAGDDAGRAFLLEGYRGYLDSLSAGAPASGAGSFQYNFVYELSRLSDPATRDALDAVEKEYLSSRSRSAARFLVEQLRMNAMPVDELMKLVEAEPRGNRGEDDNDRDPARLKELKEAGERRRGAVYAVGLKGGPDVLPRLDALASAKEAEAAAAGADEPKPPKPDDAGAANPDDEKDAPRPDPATAPTTRGAGGDGGPQTRPSPAAARARQTRLLSIAARRSADAIRCRYGLPVSLPAPASRPATQATTQPATQAATAPATQAVVEGEGGKLPEGVEVLRLERLIYSPQQPLVWSAELYSLDGLSSGELVKLSDPDLRERVRRMHAGETVAVKLSPDRSELLSVRPIEVRPGEASPRGYVFAETRKVRSGKWEHEAVVLTRLGRETVARVPNRKGEGGAAVPDAALMAQRKSTQARRRGRGGHGRGGGAEDALLPRAVPPAAAGRVRPPDRRDGGRREAARPSS